MNIRFLYQFLFINDNEEILLPCSINGLIQLNDFIIVLIGSDNEKEMNKLNGKNIYAFNEKSERIWEIEAPFQPPNMNVSYADLSLRKSGEIVAGTTQGTEYIIDISDGTVTLVENQRPW